MADSFYVDNMTVNEILNMDYQTLHKLNERDISRALRTVSLAANKRVNRLLKQARKTKDGYVPKQSAKYNIAVDALNAVTNDGKKKIKFGVKQAKNRNEMIEQINTIRKFMSMKTSTVTGAVKVRKERETRLFGKTREQASKGLSVKEKARIAREYTAFASKAYEAFRKFLEHEGIPNNPYQNFGGSDEILTLIGNVIENGDSIEDAITAALDAHTKDYEKIEDEWQAATGDSYFWSMLNSDNEE